MTLSELIDDLRMAKSMRECIRAGLVGVLQKSARPTTRVIDFDL